MSETKPQWVPVGDGPEARRIAVRDRPGTEPRVLWLGGFMSDMKGTKAVALDEWGAKTGRAVTRFDYSGHGESEGRFEDGTITKWLDEAEAVFSTFCPGPTILVGSSMGGWISLLLARRLREKGAADRLAGMVLIAPAADFTETLMWANFPEEARQSILKDGVWYRPSPYGEDPYPITRELIEDGRQNLLYETAPIETGCPVHILQGVLDDDVPWTHVTDLVSRLARDDVVLTLVKDGDHRLSRPQDIERMIAAVETVAD
ncbi:alpha/beta hydrolase [Amorphus orientalis]|uniref:Palmitoyl-protein thioesterase ABHD10, mitochondrial n=1 Tax=Amorphus orientalis TaxID=649198 RepID=A0AAE4ARZ1_9HYPH|nr:alpha/beta hydrolase [Amorphus orientalis]MDQ0314653.1 pimeloyl-ACP methyl ester carboxylesterase [Amorphus orientalis]